MHFRACRIHIEGERLLGPDSLVRRVMTKTAARSLTFAIVTLAGGLACHTVPLTAPVLSTISVSASSTPVSPGGSTEITAMVVEEAGTLVQNGTSVFFSATNGLVEPAQATTRDGVARTTFTAGSTAGTAIVTAASGGAGPGDPGNTVEIPIG